jgi:hypothetical protein
MRVAIYGAFAVSVAASAASAQRTQHTRSTAPPRVAAIAPAPSPAPSPARRYSHGAFRSDLPILLMGDGRVFADFGRGWERVERSCALPSGFASSQVVSPSGLEQPIVVQPTVTQPAAPGVQRLPYTPPVPAQQTPSQQMAERGGRLPQTSTAGRSCWAMSNGRIVVAQP